MVDAAITQADGDCVHNQVIISLRRWKAGAHGTTFGSNPVACAAGRATLQVIHEEGLLENSRRMWERFLAGLRSLQAQYPAIGEARGLGLMLAIEMIVPGTDKEPDPRTSMDLLNLYLERGLLAFMAGTFGQVVRFIPPLIVTAEQVDQALNILDEALSIISRH